MLGWLVGWEVGEEIRRLLFRRRYLGPDVGVLLLLWAFVVFGSWLSRTDKTNSQTFSLEHSKPKTLCQDFPSPRLTRPRTRRLMS